MRHTILRSVADCAFLPTGQMFMIQSSISKGARRLTSRRCLRKSLDANARLLDILTVDVASGPVFICDIGKRERGLLLLGLSRRDSSAAKSDNIILTSERDRNSVTVAG